MGIFSWFRGNNNNNNNKDSGPKSDPKPVTAPQQPPSSSSSTSEAPGSSSTSEVPGMNGAMKVPRPPAPLSDITVFEFGSVAATGDKLTLAGFCPVSDELEPCRWEILPASGPDAPQFRVVF